MSDFLSWAEAKTLASACRARGAKVVSTNGTFDLLHRGHLDYLNKARSFGALLLVAINSDASVKRYKGATRPLNSAEDRAYALSQLKSVDGVCIFEEDSPVEWLKFIQPHIHVKGADWQGKQIPEEAVLNEWGGIMKYANFLEGFSTTALIEKLKK